VRGSDSRRQQKRPLAQPTFESGRLARPRAFESREARLSERWPLSRNSFASARKAPRCSA